MRHTVEKFGKRRRAEAVPLDKSEALVKPQCRPRATIGLTTTVPFRTEHIMWLNGGNNRERRQTRHGLLLLLLKVTSTIEALCRLHLVQHIAKVFSLERSSSISSSRSSTNATPGGFKLRSRSRRFALATQTISPRSQVDLVEPTGSITPCSTSSAIHLASTLQARHIYLK